MDKSKIVQRARDVGGDMITGDKNITILPVVTFKPSNLSKLIQELAQVAPFKKASEKLDTRKLFAYSIDEKISQNSVKKYRSVINEYSSYYDMCDKTLNAIDGFNPGTKEILLRYVRNTYLIERDNLLTGSKLTFWNEIQSNADNLIDIVSKGFYDDLSNTDIYNNCTLEEVKNMLLCFVVYCFINCNILEEPEK